MENKRIIVGRLGASYGVRGWLKVISFTDPFDNLLHYPSWQLKHQGQWQTITCEECKVHGRALIVKFNECDSPEQAREYTNDLIAIDHDALAHLDDGEYYWTDLVGLQVANLDGTLLGTIDSMLETGSNDVMVIKNDKNELLLPYRDEVVKSINLEQGTMTVDWDLE
jgi:16S rRNA processing protein RimM